MLVCEVGRDGNGARVRLRGEIDAHTVGTLREAVADLAAASEGCWVIDLAEVTFVDSTGLTAILVAQRAAEACGARLVLQSPSVETLRLFEVTGLLGELDVRLGPPPQSS